MSQVTLEKVTALAKRRGFVYPSSEIYGGMANTWDFGPLGALLKENIKNSWLKYFVLERDNIVPIDASIFINPKAWEASGHVAGFTDALIDCKNCHLRTRADHLIEDNDKDVKVEGLSPEELTKIIKNKKLKCPKCGEHDWTDVRTFNLLFETSVGIVEDSKSKAYLRGEIAQGIFLNFKNVLDSTRVKIPFGIAQIGKAFRNEITMGQFIHRTLEFDLMEFEYFIHPNDWEEVYKYWQNEMVSWAKQLGIADDKLRWREHEEHERSHYSKRTMDVEYNYPFGWKEMFGLAYRTDFDLKNHATHSGKNLEYLDPKTNEKYIPHVVEPTFGLSRLVGVILFDAYTEEENRTVLKLHPSIAPYTAAVFPLLANKQDLVKKAEEVYKRLKTKLTTTFDARGNIGKRYLYQDEAGTPFCITIDFDTLDDDTVTVRERDTTKQERVPLEKIESYIQEKSS